MNILNIGIHFDKNNGGGNLRNTKMFQDLNGNDKMIFFFISYTKRKNKRYTKDKCFHIYYLNSLLGQIIYSLFINFRYHLDVIHAHNTRVLFPLILLFPFKKKILELHSFHEFHNKYKEQIFRYAIRKVDKIIVLGNLAKTLLQEKYDVDDEKIIVIINGIEKNRIRLPEKKLGDSFKVAYIGSFHLWQGVFDFVEMVKRYKQEQCATKCLFFMIGTGPEWENINMKIKEYALENEIVLTGMIQPSEIDRYWQDIDVLVIPRPSTQATEITIPLKLLDAITSNKLILASRVGGLTELLSDNNSVLYEPSNMEDLTAKLLGLISDMKKCEKIKNGCYKLASRLDSWQTKQVMLFNVYNNLVKYD